MSNPKNSQDKQENNFERWVIWERPCVPSYVSAAAEAVINPLKKHFTVPWSKKIYCFFSKRMVRGLWPKQEFIENSLFITNNFLKKEYFQGKIETYETLTKNLNEQFNLIEKTDLSKLSDQELVSDSGKFYEIFLDWWGFGQVAESIAAGSEFLLKDLNLKAGQINILSAPEEESYTVKEEKELLLIAKLILDKNLISDLENDPEVITRIKKHQRAYFWINNNYLEVEYLDEQYFIKKIKEILEKNKNINETLTSFKELLLKIKENKENLFRELNFSERDRYVLELISYFVIFQDQRKALSIKAHYYLQKFIDEFAKRSNIEKELVKYALPHEYKNILNKKLNADELKKRTEYFAVIFSEEGYEIFNKEDAEKKEKELLGVVGGEVIELRGMGAMKGIVTGRAKIILHKEDFSKMQPGDVLVTTMTSPDFILSVKKATAIVTDEGGLTCHAAIITRELGIPSVIGTRFATRTIKDNDIIEVDATHSVVRIKKENKK